MIKIWKVNADKFTFSSAEAVPQRSSVRKVFLEISQNSPENVCARVSFLIKLQGLKPATLLKKRLWHRCFPVNFAKFLRTPFLIEHLWWLLLVVLKPENLQIHYKQIFHRTSSKELFRCLGISYNFWEL